MYSVHREQLSSLLGWIVCKLPVVQARAAGIPELTSESSKPELLPHLTIPSPSRIKSNCPHSQIAGITEPKAAGMCSTPLNVLV